jgi:hypothetical protein
MWKFLAEPTMGTLFIDSTRDETFPNGFQVLDQIVVTRGLLSQEGLRLRRDSVGLCTVATDRTVAESGENGAGGLMRSWQASPGGGLSARVGRGWRPGRQGGGGGRRHLDRRPAARAG